MAMIKSLAELERECRLLNLQVSISGKKPAKKDYINALATHHLSKRSEVTPGMKYRLGVESPQLAFLGSNLRPEELQKIYEDPAWVFEEKLNGSRMVVTYFPEIGFELFGRNVGVSDFLPIEYTKSVYMGDQDLRGVLPPFVIDCELLSSDPSISTVMGSRGVITETPLQAVSALIALNPEETIELQKELSKERGNPVLEFHAFDLLMYDGTDVKNLPYIERRKMLLPLIEKLRQLGLNFHRVKAVQKRKLEYLYQLWDSGKEGCVAKRIDQPYVSRNSRPRGGWIKLKRTMSGAMGDSIDGWISGYELGTPGKGFEKYVGILYISINLEMSDGSLIEHEIARTSNMPLEMRKSITAIDPVTGNPCLHPEMYGKVVEFDGQTVSARARRFVHPRFIRVREDKSPDQCVMTEEFLNSQIL